MQFPVTRDEKLEDIDGAFLWEQYDQTGLMQIRRGIFQGDSLFFTSLLYGSQSSEKGVEQNLTATG